MSYDFSGAADLAEFPIPEQFEETPIVCPVCGDDSLYCGLVIDFELRRGFNDAEVQIKIVSILNRTMPSVGLVGERRLIGCYCEHCDVHRLLQITHHKKGTAYVAWKTGDENLFDDVIWRQQPNALLEAWFCDMWSQCVSRVQPVDDRIDIRVAEEGLGGRLVIDR